MTAALPAPIFLAPLRTEAVAARLGLRRSRSARPLPGTATNAAGTPERTAPAPARVERVGMGRSRAEVARARLARLAPPGAPMAVIGFGGGLSPDDRAGDIVVASSISASDHSAPGVDCDAALVEAVRLALAERLPTGSVRAGPIICIPRLMTAKERPELAATGAQAVDMESAWLSPLAASRPFVVVRAIVDYPGRGLASPRIVTGGIAAFRRLVIASSVVADVLSHPIAPVTPE